MGAIFTLLRKCPKCLVARPLDAFFGRAPHVVCSTCASNAPLEGVDAKRPRKRSECETGPRPCPWVSCRYHLLAEDAARAPSSRHDAIVNEMLAMPQTCALDVADDGGLTLAEVATHLHVSRERVRQIEHRTLQRLGVRMANKKVTNG